MKSLLIIIFELIRVPEHEEFAGILPVDDVHGPRGVKCFSHMKLKTGAGLNDQITSITCSNFN